VLWNWKVLWNFCTKGINNQKRGFFTVAPFQFGYKMIDYIEVTKHLSNKDTINLGHLQYEAEYASGLHKFFVNGCRNMELQYNPSLGYIRLKGSPLYFIQGHNFTWNKQSFTEAIKYIEKLISLNLFDSTVDKLEYGKILKIEAKPQRIIAGHLAGKGLTMEEKSRDKGNIRYFNDSNVSLKLYNAGTNIQHKQGLTMKGIIQEAGWNAKDNFLKFEAHYRKPHISLNNGKGFSLSDMLIPSFERTLKSDLYNQYQRLEKMKSLEIPSSKKELSSGNIILLALAEIAINQGKDIKKLIDNYIRAIPEEILNQEDKKARRKQIKSMLGKVHSSDINEFDISDQLADALKI